VFLSFLKGRGGSVLIGCVQLVSLIHTVASDADADADADAEVVW